MELLVPKRQSVSIELNGERVACASAVKCVCVKERRAIRAFGEAEAVAWLERSPSYRLELSQLSVPRQIGRSSLWEMSDFRLVTVQDGVRTVYSGCEWQELTERADAGDGFLAEHAVMTARKRSREEEPV
ncbi:hypothetical protein [Faecalispora sporosphaeroides]|uniref:Uncharacterized protein n=1 Tax=Faecalispora sporosphaeroides TaxID=1549 RepID=A0A928KSG9_9FIRM|nr:hypothetical protein [Faecalispora sporosphaeroides]MBE6833434.1 hypothetical protein [Faecalispora sporosphaeroides]